jgi:hypothetical protein
MKNLKRILLLCAPVVVSLASAASVKSSFIQTHMKINVSEVNNFNLGGSVSSVLKTAALTEYTDGSTIGRDTDALFKTGDKVRISGMDKVPICIHLATAALQNDKVDLVVAVKKLSNGATAYSSGEIDGGLIVSCSLKKR